MSEHKYWVGFNIIKGIGPAGVKALLARFGSLQAAWEAPEHSLRAVSLGRRARANLLRQRQSLDLDRVMARLEQAGVQVLTWDDAGYPQTLRHIDDAPPVLYVKGALTEADQWAVAVVGTRKATGYGKTATQEIVAGLARNGVSIVSGLALGIDGAAHRAALDAGGRTIAVLGCGVDVIYPTRHRDLAQRILDSESGAIISDYPLGTRPEAKNFPPRNRIISGLSLAVLVVEAGERSGALITTRYAAEQGRDVFAVPGPIVAAGSRGTNRLIQDGAKLVMSADDILAELNLGMAVQQAEARQHIPTNDTEAQLLELLAAGPMHVDELCRRSGLTAAKVSSDLTLLQLKGLINDMGSMTYALASASGIREARARYVVD